MSLTQAITPACLAIVAAGFYQRCLVLAVKTRRRWVRQEQHALVAVLAVGVGVMVFAGAWLVLSGSALIVGEAWSRRDLQLLWFASVATGGYLGFTARRQGTETSEVAATHGKSLSVENRRELRRNDRIRRAVAWTPFPAVLVPYMAHGLFDLSLAAPARSAGYALVASVMVMGIALLALFRCPNCGTALLASKVRSDWSPTDEDACCPSCMLRFGREI